MSLFYEPTDVQEFRQRMRDAGGSHFLGMYNSPRAKDLHQKCKDNGHALVALNVDGTSVLRNGSELMIFAQKDASVDMDAVAALLLPLTPKLQRGQSAI